MAIEEYRERCEEKQERVDEERDKFMEYKRVIALNSVSSRTGKPMSPKVERQKQTNNIWLVSPRYFHSLPCETTVQLSGWLRFQDVDLYLNAEMRKEAEVVTVRLENIKLKNKLHKTEMQLKSKVYISDAVWQSSVRRGWRKIRIVCYEEGRGFLPSFVWAQQ